MSWPSSNTSGTSYDPANADNAHWVRIQTVLDRLSQEAAALRRVGYESGLEVAEFVRWSTLEQLPTSPERLALTLRSTFMGNEAADYPNNCAMRSFKSPGNSSTSRTSSLTETSNGSSPSTAPLTFRGWLLLSARFGTAVQRRIDEVALAEQPNDESAAL